MTPTDETRFHALKFALQTAGVDAGNALHVANDYHRFLTGATAEAPKAFEQPEPVGGHGDETSCIDTMVTESLDAAEAVVAEVAADEADSGEEEPYEADYAEEPQAFAYTRSAFLPKDTHVTSAMLDGSDGWLDVSPPSSEPEPTFEYIAAAVEEIASPPPPAEEDPSDEPELTTEQCERIEDAVRVAPKEPEPEVKPARAAWVDYVS